MKYIVDKLSRFPALKIVLVYAIVSAVYIYTSDYFLEIFTSDVTLLSRLQTYKGLGFIIVTSALLYILVKRNIVITSTYYQRIIALKETSDIKISNSRQEYMSLFENSPLPTWLFDTDSLKFLLVNDAATETYGYSRDEFLKMTLRDIRPVEEIPLLEDALSASQKLEKFAFHQVFKHKKKDGSIIDIKLKVCFVNFEGKRVKLAPVTDISPEMKIQERLLETNSRLQMASEIAGMGYWTNDIVREKIQWSDEVYKIFELDSQSFSLTLENIKQLFQPKDQANFDYGFYKNLEHQNIYEKERQIITPSGKTKWILERQYLTKDQVGSPIRIDGIVLDVTTRKLYEQKIEASNERFKMLTKATVEAIIDWDIQNNEVIWGEGFQTILGYDLTNTDFHLWSKNIHADDRKRVLLELNQTMEDPAKHHFNAEFRFMKANGDIIYMQHRGIFIRNKDGKAIRALGAMIDLTDALKNLHKIEKQDKALKEIAWTQSHIVRAPLANLMGLVSLMKHNEKNGTRDEEILQYISDSADKLDRVIREIVNKTVVD